MDDGQFDDLLDEYLSGRGLPNPDMEDVEIEWVRGNPEFGADHIRDHDYPNRTIFWGATRAGRWLFVSCEDCKRGARRILKPITAFEPEEGEEYWRKQ